jgi:hypothetical protein
MGGYTGPGGVLRFRAFEFSGSLCLVGSVFAPELGFMFSFLKFCFKKDAPEGPTAKNGLPLG